MVSCTVPDACVRARVSTATMLQANLQRVSGAFGDSRGSVTKDDMAFAVVDFFNVVLGSGVKSKEFWTQVRSFACCHVSCYARCGCVSLGGERVGVGGCVSGCG